MNVESDPLALALRPVALALAHASVEILIKGDLSISTCTCVRVRACMRVYRQARSFLRAIAVAAAAARNMMDLFSFKLQGSRCAGSTHNISDWTHHILEVFVTDVTLGTKAHLAVAALLHRYHTHNTALAYQQSRLGPG